MSRYRRQSYYLAAKRKSAAPIVGNGPMCTRFSEEELADDTGTVIGITPPIASLLGPNLITASPLRTVQSQIPPPSLETMQVIKGFEFVTFTPSKFLFLNFISFVEILDFYVCSRCHSTGIISSWIIRV